ncbi:MAG: UDP-N-acetylmuramoyl-L-alanyl-D-glutamate--2,6-diaminopimelate ligase [Firmicutes bacterium]|nr:UDP-N-acetylmuramoyl-L-alanyl-D-glutamate--2,6-diaminopimelate ligase [Bacillota bacterium]
MEDDPVISGISCDSRSIRPGDLFLALSGTKDHGRNHMTEAIRRGAAAAIAEKADGSPLKLEDASALARKYYLRPDRRLKVIGVTGTNGKTTTTWLIRQCLADLGVGCGLIGTVAYDTGGERMEASRTTPQPDQLWRLLHEMTEHGLEVCAMEVSSHGLALGRVSGLEFSYGIFTNLTEDHLDYHGTMEAYYQAKKTLFSQVDRRSFIHVKESWGQRLYEELKREGHPVQGLSLKEGPVLNMALPGTYNQENGIMAWAVCSEIAKEKGLDHPEERVAKALERIKAVPGRFEALPNALGWNVFVDYAHTPDALERLLHTAKPLVREGGKLICVFGCGGDREREKRAKMGEISGRLADLTIVTSDNPRSERPEDIASEIEAGIRRTKGQYEILLDRKKAMEKALVLCNNKNVVIIAGKGHETTQIIGNKTYPFDDRIVAGDILRRIEKGDLK